MTVSSRARANVARDVRRGTYTGVRSRLPVALALFLPAALVRLVLAPLTAWPNDTYPWVTVGWDLLAGYGPYDRLGFSYPPGWAAVLALVLRPLALVFPPDRWATLPSSGLTDLPVPHPITLLAVKLPSILADLAVGWLLYRKSARAAALWLFNPLVIFVSSVHGQYDAFVSLTVLLALIAVLGGAAFLSGLACGLGTALKLTPLYAGPILLAAVVHRGLRAGKLRRAMLEPVRWGLGGLIGLLPALALLSTGFRVVVNARLGVAARTSDGLNPGALRRTPWAADWRLWTDWYPTLSQVLLIALPLAFALIVLVRGEQALIPAVTGGLTAVVVFQPVTQPQYILWVIPSALLSGSRAYAVLASVLALPALLYYDGLVGNLVAYVSQPLSLYLHRGYPFDATMTGHLDYLAQTGAFGGQSVSDSIGQFGALISPIWLCLLLVSLWKALRDGHEER
ncbi:hypothetical protein NET02_03430 [Thermomicrobiaceae bacterium CFH 74404]|uniref:DUF2029 domain-containing protein n=1 Tax=Thermalbibacter longus TaxID=2951981 RepID=A0AA42B9F0_9BACT|nr:hypothetical protein [Thermalbibacter longus]MCM8748187.1 hypothetical protein [Thermalbibacter longus]